MGVFAMAFRTPLDADTYWHLRAGQWEVEHRAVLASDMFSFTRAGQPWLNVHWLAQIVLYAAFALFRDAGLGLFTAVLAAAGMALIYRACQGESLIQACSVLLGAAAAAVFWSARSQMFSFLFGAVVVYLLWLYQKRGIDRLWFISVMMIPWANTHGGFAIGFILLTLALIGEAARWLITILSDHSGSGRPTLRPVIRIAVIAAVSAAAVLINPFGVSTLLLPFRTVGIGVLRDFIREWAAPDFHSAQMWPFGVMLIGTLVSAGVSSRRLDVRDAVMLAGTVAGALLAVRNIPTFVLVAAPVLSLHVDCLLTDIQLRPNSSRVAARGAFVAFNWALLALVGVGVVVKMIYEVAPSHLSQEVSNNYPVEAVRYLEEKQIPHELFNSYNWGGYLIWNARDYPVYVDGRTDLYDDQFIRGYVKVATAQAGWNETLLKAGVNTVLIETNSPLAQALALSPDWSRVYSDSLATIYVRRGSASP
jgi:hypothetical protein